MKAKEYLSQVRYSEEKIAKMKIDIEEYRRLAWAIPGCDYDSIKVDCTRDNEAPFKKWIIKAADLERDLVKLQSKYDETRNEVISTIDLLQDSDLKRVLLYKYINGMSWSAIADKMYSSSSSVKRWHWKALDLINEKMDRVGQG